MKVLVTFSFKIATPTGATYSVGFGYTPLLHHCQVVTVGVFAFKLVCYG